MADPLDYPLIPCPECAVRLGGNLRRIGNSRKACTTCNNFAQAVMRRVRSRMKKVYPEDYKAFRMEAELELYPGVISAFNDTHE